MKALLPWTITVIIPAFKPDDTFRTLLERLEKQDTRADRILIVNTGEAYFPKDLTLPDNAEVVHIAENEFDHGGTRDMAARMTDTDLIVFMTQDAVPAGPRLLWHLCAPFADPSVAACYARQLPRKDAGLEEQFARIFNYGAESFVKREEDLPRLGIKTFFCSNVCAAYRRSVYLELGGFERKTIFNEDMIFASKIIRAGYGIAYEAKARVIHSHNYSGMAQLRRNFDLGVSQAQHPEVFDAVPSEGEGKRLVAETAAYLVRKGRPFLTVHLAWISACKLAGYRLGRAYKKLPGGLVRTISLNRKFWDEGTGEIQ